MKSLSTPANRDLVNNSSKSHKNTCPNCWGRQEYEGNFYKALKPEIIDTNNVEDKRGWIEGYVEKNLLGIKLVTKDEGLICEQCHTSYKLDK